MDDMVAWIEAIARKECKFAKTSATNSPVCRITNQLTTD
jgi:hypothetical protein